MVPRRPASRASLAEPPNPPGRGAQSRPPGSTPGAERPIGTRRRAERPDPGARAPAARTESTGTCHPAPVTTGTWRRDGAVPRAEGQRPSGPNGTCALDAPTTASAPQELAGRRRPARRAVRSGTTVGMGVAPPVGAEWQCGPPRERDPPYVQAAGPAPLAQGTVAPAPVGDRQCHFSVRHDGGGAPRSQPRIAGGPEGPGRSPLARKIPSVNRGSSNGTYRSPRGSRPGLWTCRLRRTDRGRASSGAGGCRPRLPSGRRGGDRARALHVAPDLGDELLR
jgi:hypothetical protein